MPSSLAETSPRRRYVAELQGLRGLALLLVVVFHLFGQGRVSGGVDVFLVVSAFLCTLTVTSRLDDGTFAPSRQVGRTFWRLLPLSLLVLAVVALLTALVLPATRWPGIAQQVAASAVGLENWELVRTGLSYGGAGPSANPLQHFWSLSVQLQFLVVWPLVLLGVHRFARRTGVPARRAVAGLVGAMTLLSFAHAAVTSVTDQDVAYYSTFTRFWELGIGAALALVFPYLRLPRRLGGVLVVGGLLLLVTCGFVLDGGSLFPGPWALWPVGAASLVIVGSAGGSPLARRLLDNRPWRVVADSSYALYLWHWPVMVFYLAYRFHLELGYRGAVLVLLVSCALAWATTRLVERPLRSTFSRIAPRRSILVVAAACLTVALGGLGVTTSIHTKVQDELVLAADRSTYVGARALHEGADGGEQPPRPAPELAAFDKPVDDSCVQSHLDAPRYDAVVRCPLTTGAQDAPRLALVGGSHIEQWIPAAVAVAERHGWSVTAMIKHGCRLGVETPSPPDRPACGRWSANAMEELTSEPPDLVLLSGTWTGTSGVERPPDEGQILAWDELVLEGVDVVALRDTPRFAWSVPECLLENGTPDPCAKHRDLVYAEWSTVRAPATDAHQLDVSELFCSARACSAVIGNVVAYQDRDHLTATYARTLTGALDAELQELGLSIHVEGPEPGSVTKVPTESPG
ncbi:acyltransferase family protein [Cellulosimicrobium arenosum]|uniref:Acyltransferase n=1 Tax=Cellulosimicrobium arenosum TaxID=2708133 RepID=A0A927IZU5_9MICO|nr:acyltransferase family protein [Cellulosimicrobium arenosum]MBD8078925.1 acyltransferase [Cellulosimicrobium arenosum]